MGTRYDLPRIVSTDTPSLLNHETAKWAFIGNLIGTVAGLAVGVALTVVTGGVAPTLLMPLFGLGGMAWGALHGGKIGKAQQERELVEGKVVHDPSYWNKGILTGLVLGRVAGMALTLLTGPVGMGFGLIGAVVGSVVHKNTLDKEMNTALVQRDAQVSVARAQSMQRGMGQGVGQYHDSVSSQEMQAMETQQDARRSEQSYTQSVLDQAQLSSEPQR